MSKIDRIIQLAKDISHQIVQSPDHWKQYLNTAARVYKYPFRGSAFHLCAKAGGYRLRQYETLER